jgi:hypothetical protein
VTVLTAKQELHVVLSRPRPFTGGSLGFRLLDCSARGSPYLN